MVDGAFAADLDWLEQLCNQLTSDMCSFEAALNALEETGPIRTGHDDLDDSCSDFHDRWGYGLKVMNKDIATMSEKIKAGVQNYRSTEAALTNAFSPAGAASTPGAPPATGGPDIQGVLG